MTLDLYRMALVLVVQMAEERSADDITTLRQAFDAGRYDGLKEALYLLDRVDNKA